MYNWPLEDLLLVQEAERARPERLPEWMLDDLRRAKAGPGVRRSAAAALVRLGLTLDGDAGERALEARRIAIGDCG